MSKRYELKNFLNSQDKWIDAVSGVNLDSFDILDIINTQTNVIDKLKSENEKFGKELRKSHNKNGDNDLKLKSRQQYMQNLEQQLKEKDEQIEKWKLAHERACEQINTLMGEIADERKAKGKLVADIKTNTKQICEKIRSFIKENEYKELDDRYIGQLVDVVQTKGLKEFLDQIERGEV